MKPPRYRKVVSVNCRVTTTEMKELKRLANTAGLSVSEYIRAQLFRSPVETRVEALEAAVVRILDRTAEQRQQGKLNIVENTIPGGLSVRAGGIK